MVRDSFFNGGKMSTSRIGAGREVVVEKIDPVTKRRVRIGKIVSATPPPRSSNNAGIAARDAANPIKTPKPKQSKNILGKIRGGRNAILHTSLGRVRMT